MKQIVFPKQVWRFNEFNTNYYYLIGEVTDGYVFGYNLTVINLEKLQFEKITKKVTLTLMADGSYRWGDHPAWSVVIDRCRSCIEDRC